MVQNRFIQCQCGCHDQLGGREAPSAVNDSARAEMAAVAKWRDDISATVTTGGSATAYTVATNSVYDTLANMNGAMIALVPHTTNGATVTLNVDGLGAKPLRAAPSVELPAGVLVQGTPYVATYYQATSEFILHGFYGDPFGIPIGGGMPYFLPTPPNSSFVFPFGQAISRATYATLFAGMGTTFGVGDGSTTFNLPDLRGRVLAGRDDMGGSAASRITSGGSGITGTTLGATGGAETVMLEVNMMPSHTHLATIIDPGHSHLLHWQDRNVASTAGPLFSDLGGISNDQKVTDQNTTGISVLNSNTGGGSAHSNVQPTIVVNYVLRII
jgi:microcystin-dependent protein